MSRIKVKSVTLTPGYWIYVCPCGFQYSVSRVTKKEGKWMIYCFKCKEQTGKYYKVMTELNSHKTGTGNLIVTHLLRCGYTIRSNIVLEPLNRYI